MISIREVLKPLNLTAVRELEKFTAVQDASVTSQARRALIKGHHERLGGLKGRIGISMGDLKTVSNGVMMPYSGGSIHLLNHDGKPHGYERHRAEVRFVGYKCHDSSEKSPDAPYFIIGISGLNAERNVTKRFGSTEEETVEDDDVAYLEEVVTLTAQPPFTITVVAMENDAGDPDAAAASVKQSLDDGVARLQVAAVLFGINPAIGGMVQAFENIFGDWISGGISAIFGMGDDLIGTNAFHLATYDEHKDEWRNPKQGTHPGFEKPFNVAMRLNNGEGGDYTAFFQVDVFKDNSLRTEVDP